jgi:hypothetical protein
MRALLLLLLLSACAAKAPQVVTRLDYVRPALPPGVFPLPPAPPLPRATGLTNRQVAAWIIAEWADDTDLRGRLQAVQAALSPPSNKKGSPSHVQLSQGPQ